MSASLPNGTPAQVPGSTGDTGREGQNQGGAARTEIYDDGQKAKSQPGFEMAFPNDGTATGSRENPNHGKRSYPAQQPTL